MPRVAEACTITSLLGYLESATAEFVKADAAAKAAEQVKKVPDAFQMLNDSAALHTAEGTKYLRKITVQVVKALDEQGTDTKNATKLIDMAKSLKLFPETSVKAAAKVQASAPEEVTK